MIRTYFEYMTLEYPKDAVHGMLLVNLTGPTAGLPWTCDSARKLLRRAGKRLGLGLVTPHQFRHDFGSSVLHASGGNSAGRPGCGRVGISEDRRGDLRARRRG